MINNEINKSMCLVTYVDKLYIKIIKFILYVLYLKVFMNLCILNGDKQSMHITIIKFNKHSTNYENFK